MAEGEEKQGGRGLPILKALAVGGGVALLVALFTYSLVPGFFQGMEYRLYDMRVRFATDQMEQLDQ